MKLMLISVLFLTSQNTLYSQAAHAFCDQFAVDNADDAVGNPECPTQQELNRVNDTLCGVANRTILECHASRVSCENSAGQHWTSVCLFSPSDNVREYFVDNYRDYNCQVMGNFGCANCTSRRNSNFNFITACNFTFYFCEGNPLECHSRFSSVLEEGGRCPPPDNSCPSPDLFSMTHSFFCEDRTLLPFDYGFLERLEIRSPPRCTDHSTIMYVILLLVVVVLLIAVVGTVLLCKYRKLKAGVLATMEGDDVIKMGDTMNEDLERFLKLHQNTDSRENVDLFIPKLDLSLQKHPSSSDTGFNETSSDEILPRTEDSNSESQVLLTNSNSVIIFNNFSAEQNRYEINENQESDEETAEYELKTYLTTRKLKDSNSNSDVQIPTSSEEKDWMASVANDQEAQIEDEENVEYELRTYSLRRRLNSSDAQLEIIPPSSSGNEPLLINISSLQNEDQNCDFPGYLKKNEADEFPGLLDNFITDSVDIADNNNDINDTAGDSMPCEVFAVPNYLRKTDYSYS